MAHIKIDSNGIKKYRDDIGQLHREDGPARLTPEGSKVWYNKGSVHRNDDNGPAEILSDGTMLWGNYPYEKKHRMGQPDTDSPCGWKSWSAVGFDIWPEL